MKEVIKNEVSLYYNTKYTFRIMLAEATFCQKCYEEYKAKCYTFKVLHNPYQWSPRFWLHIVCTSIIAYIVEGIAWKNSNESATRNTIQHFRQRQFNKIQIRKLLKTIHNRQMHGQNARLCLKYYVCKGVA